MVRQARTTSAAATLLVAVAVVIHTTTDHALLAEICYLGVMTGAAVAAWMGAERAPTGQRLVPRLIASGISLTALGDVLWSVLDLTGADTDVSIADPPWFASYVLLCAALWVVLGRTRAGRRADLDFAIDAATIVTVSVLVFWTISVEDIVADPGEAPLVRAVWAAYPIADAVLLALVVRALASRSARAVIGPSFAVGVCLWLAADIAYLQAPDSRAVEAVMDAAWMVAPVLLAQAAWRVRDLTRVGVAPDAPARGRWVPQLGIAVGPLLVPPALEVVADLRGAPDQPMRLLVGTLVLIALALARTGRLMQSEERALDDLALARDAALAASRAKSLFLANMSHEIRTPLTTVLASAEMLEDTPLTEVQQTLVTRMRRSGVVLLTLVEEVLDFSRIEAGRDAPVRKDFDLHALVGHLADVHTARADPGCVDFEWVLDAHTPRTVVGDPTRLFQVVNNLLDNAFKFTHSGSVRLVVRPSTYDGGGAGSVDFVVADTGIGIAETDLAAVFESFSQVDSSMTRRYGGSGLGLAICRNLAEKMGGTVAVESRPGAGSTFTVRIPLPPGARRVSAEHLVDVAAAPPMAPAPLGA